MARAANRKQPSNRLTVEPSKLDLSLEPSADEMRRLVGAALERIVAHIESLPQQKAADVEGALALARSVRESMPEQGTSFEALLALIFDKLAPKSFNTA